ncbi:MAG: acetate--CoA ligase family protein [Candidatus Aenigmatarchaeota archaeon]
MSPLFNPKSIAVIGASRNREKVGNILLRNLVGPKCRGFKGDIYPINPNARRILGKACYPSVGAVGKEIDLGLIATKAEAIPEILEGAKNLRSCIIISSGFSEVGNNALRDSLMAAARKNNIRVLGPNCIGLQVPAAGFNATFMRPALKGEYAIISQSGAFCSSIIDWSVDNMVGFSKIISIGNAYDVSFPELIDYLQKDRSTRKILIYVEGMARGREFMEAARRSKKPIYALKVGKTPEGKKAAKTHTGAMAGTYEIYKDVFRQVGVTEIMTIKDFFMFLKMSRMARKEAIVLTNAGGPGTATADLLCHEKIRLKKLAPSTMEKLGKILPKNWSRSNPVDILGDATPERYEQALKILSKEDANIIVVLTPQEMTDPKETARRILGYKNVVAVFIGGEETDRAREILSKKHVPAFEFSEQAVRCLGLLR